MNRSNRKPLRAVGRALVAVTLWAGASAIAYADSNAYTDDKSVDVPTAAYVYVNQTPAQITTLLDNNQARLTDIEVADAATNKFTVTMVRNSGVYAAGWFWYVGKTFAQVQSLVSSNNGRLIDIEPYSTSNGTRYAVIMVVNTGNTARGWTYLSGVSAAQVDAHISSTGNRLIQLQSYVEGSVTKYAIITVANTGADNKAWQYWYNQTPAQVGTRLSSFGGRLTSLERRSTGNYDIVLVKNAGADSHYFLYYTGLTTSGALVDLANQFGSRLFDVSTYVVSGQRRYDALLIDNSTAENRRIRTAFGGSLNGSSGLPNGQWGAYLRQVGVDSPSVNINGGRRFEPASAIKAVHNLAVMRKVQAGTDTLNATLTYYNYGTSDEPNVCPDPARETTSFDFTNTVDVGKDNMMSASDNRYTRAITLRYATNPNNRGPSGIAYIEGIAVNTAGMTSTFIDQDRIGCGYVNDRRNQTTLIDLGKLYEGVEDGTLLGTGTFRTEFYQPMNGQAFGTSGVEGLIRAVVQQEGASLGKTTAEINDFIARMDWRFKPGGYGLGCDGNFAPCTNGFISIATIAGRLTLPSKTSRGTIALRQYVFGRYTADRNVCEPTVASGKFGSCADAPSGFPRTTTEASVRQNVDKELFRAVIRQNLATF